MRLREYVRAADLLPNNAAAQLAAARMLIDARQFEDGATRAKKAIELEPKNAEAHIRLGSALAGTRDFDAAVKQIQEAIAIDPSGDAGHVNMGALLLAQGRKGDAQASFEKAVELAPKSVDARMALALYYLNTGKVREAEAALKGAIAIDPAAEQPNRAMAAVLISTGRAVEAEPYVQAATKAAATPEAQLALAEYYMNLKRVDAARPILEALAADDKLFAAANVRLARIDYDAGRKDVAHKRVDDVLTRVPNSDDALVVKGQWLVTEQKYAEARRVAEAAVKATPTSASAQFLLGRAMLATGDRQGAEEAFAEVLRLNPRAAAAQTELARLKLAAGEGEAGLQLAQRRGQAAQPGNNDARVLLVRALLSTAAVGAGGDRAGSPAPRFPRTMPPSGL